MFEELAKFALISEISLSVSTLASQNDAPTLPRATIATDLDTFNPLNLC